MGGMAYILAQIYLLVLEVINDCESPTKLTPQPTLSGFPFAYSIHNRNQTTKGQIKP